MKTTKKEHLCRVSDRAYRTIISDVIDSMTGCKIDPFTFKQVVTAVRHYLTDGKITGLGKKAKQIFERRLPELDRAIRRSSVARAAAARRKTVRDSSASGITAEPEKAAMAESVSESCVSESETSYESSGDAFAAGGNLLRSAGGNDAASVFPSAGPEVDNVVGVADHVEIMLDHHDSGPVGNKTLEHVD